MDSVKVRAAAKLNLALEITGVSGKLHTLDMLCCSVNLYEVITLSKANDITLTCNKKNVPTDRSNTAVRAAEEFFEATKCRGGVDIYIEKSVPVGAGMGGGSADAAGVLVGLNHLFETGLTLTELCDIGIKIGSDVPLCIIGGLCRVGGVGDKVETLDSMAECFFVVTMAGEGVSTAEAYSRFDELGTDAKTSTELAVQSIGTPDFYSTFSNDLEYSTTIDIEPIKSRLMKCGAVTAMMTGSGAAVFGVFDKLDLARCACESLEGEAWLLRPIGNGVEILS